MVKVNPAGLKLYNVELWNQSLGVWPMYPVVFEETVREAAVSYSERNSRVMIVGVMLEGSLEYRFSDGTEFMAEAGSLFSIPIGTGYTFKSTPSGGRYRKVLLEFHGEILPQFCELLHIDHPFHAMPSSLREIDADIRDIGLLIKAGRAEDVPLVLSKTYGFLVKLSLMAKGTPLPDMRLLAKAQSRLENDEGGTQGIAALAAELGVCNSMLNRLFQRRLGVSPVKYRIQRKMEKAKRLLSHTALPIKEVSLRLGYANQLYFSGDFKRNCGLSPREFRRRNLAENGL